MARTTANTATVQQPAAQPAFDARAYLAERMAARQAASGSVFERITNTLAGTVKAAAYNTAKAGDRILTGAPDIWAAGKAVGEAQAAGDVAHYVNRAAAEIEAALANR
jgi:hypothetical protein